MTLATMPPTKNKTDISELKTLVADLLAQAKVLGASQAEVTASSEAGFSVSVRLGEVETVEYHNERSLGITVYFGKHSGSASTGDLSAEALQTTLEKACNIARFTGEDPYSGLADASLMARHYPELDLYYPWQLTPERAIELGIECESMARAADKRITNSEGAGVNTYEYAYVYGNTHDFIGGYKTSRHSLSCSLIASDGHDMQRDYEYTSARDANDLDAIAVLAKRAAMRTAQRLGAQTLSTRQVPVIFSAETARSLLGHFITAISGSNLYRKSSFLLDHLNKPVFPPFITIDERPHLAKAIGSVPFDSDGVSTRAREIVKEGVLQGYVLGTYSARRLGMASTGNADGVHNLFINTDSMDFPGLLKKMGTGLLVTETIGQGVNIVTGDYSRGAFGFWVENGQIQYPVQEITIAGNLKDMFANIVAVANDVDHRGNIHTGSILIEQMTVAGQ